MVTSAIYEGTIRHRRFSPHRHAFRYRLFMMYLDLAELPDLFDGHPFWSARGPAPAWFRRSDYLGDPGVALDDAVRQRVRDATGRAPDGPIRLLTHLRYFGHCFNPVSFYYCWDAADARVETVVAEITNTPWRERHAYVLGRETGSGKREASAPMRFRFPKAFHVSPFFGLNLQYDWRFSEPGDKLAVHMENYDAETKVFDATLSLKRRAITTGGLTRVLLQYPVMTARVVTAIHWQAVRLWLKRTPFHVHPAKRPA